MEVAQNGSTRLLSGGAQNVFTEALKMKEEGGWDTVRPAITTAMRYVLDLSVVLVLLLFTLMLQGSGSYADSWKTASGPTHSQR